ncbi:MAG: sulfite exporter TauE/SafE family protein [Nocardioides sp.]
MTPLSAAPWPWFVVGGALVGTLTGFFGVGGSSIATPVLSLLGVPGLLAIASPLPATIPSAIAAAIPYIRSKAARPRAAAWSLGGALPATVAGALLSEVVGGSTLLVASGIVLIPVGLRVVRPIGEGSRHAGTARRQNRPLLVAASAAVGLFTGLLANGGGFLLVPMYLLLFGLTMTEAAGTSLLVISVLTMPTLVTHWALGHIDWSVAGAFAVGAVPASMLSGIAAQRTPGGATRRAFGWFLALSGAAFALYRLTTG